MEIAAAKMIGAGLAMTAGLGAGIGLGNIFNGIVSGIARNPEAKDESELHIRMANAAFNEYKKTMINQQKTSFL